jgi:hypothetical protein
MTEDEASEPLTGRVGPLVNIAEGAVREIAKAGTGREITELPALLQNLPEKDHWQDIRLKRIYALTLLIALGVQVAIADGVFVAYAWAGADWKLTPAVINVWLGATVVQVIGVVLVVTRYLFPRRDNQT